MIVGKRGPRQGRTLHNNTNVVTTCDAPILRNVGSQPPNHTVSHPPAPALREPSLAHTSCNVTGATSPSVPPLQTDAGGPQSLCISALACVATRAYCSIYFVYDTAARYVAGSMRQPRVYCTHTGSRQAPATDTVRLLLQIR